MHCLAPVCEFFLGSLPGSLDHLRICQLIKYAVATKDNKVIIVLNLVALYVWCGDHNFWIS